MTTNKTNNITNDTAILAVSSFYGVDLQSIKLEELKSESNLRGLFFLRATNDAKNAEKRINAIGKKMAELDSTSDEYHAQEQEKSVLEGKKAELQKQAESLKIIGPSGERISPEISNIVALWVFGMYKGEFHDNGSGVASAVEKAAETLQQYANKHADFVMACAQSGKNAKTDKAFYQNVKKELESAWDSFLPGRQFHANKEDALAFFAGIHKFTCKADINMNISEKSGISCRKTAATKRVIAQLLCFKLEKKELKFQQYAKKAAK